MPAITADGDEPDEKTREYADLDTDPGGDTMIVAPGDIPAETAAPEESPTANAKRVRIVLSVIVLLLVAAALVVWWLVR
jgi:hypothetical protein